MDKRYFHAIGWLTTVLMACPFFFALPANASSEDEAIKIRDLYFGETLYHFYQKKYFTAISNLLVAQKKHPIKSQENDPELLLGGLYLSYNMNKPAAQIFNQLAKKETDKSINSSAWYYLARMAYEKNNLKQAQQAANKVTHKLPSRYNDEFQHLRGNILLKGEKYDKAIKVLENFSGATEWSNYAKFNLATALIKTNKQKQGMALLNEVASIETRDEEQVALRDKANLALGYSALRDKQYDSATAYFKQIRLVGSQSNKALLGIGWAYHKEGKLKRSLVPWIELKDRASKDASVQEALLTIPYALEGLNAKQQALSYYNTAINSYNSELTSINKVIKAVKSGEFIGALRAVHRHQKDENHLHYTSLPNSIATPYLQELIAEQNFQSILKTYRDLIYMQNILEHWDNQIPSYQLMLSERKKAYYSRLPQLKSFHNDTKQSVLTTRLKELNDQFQKVSRNTYMLTLANEQEINLLKRLYKIKLTLDKAPESALKKQRIQYRLYKGIVSWQIATDYAPRHWQIKKQLIQMERSLSELKKKKKASLALTLKTSKYFSDFSARIKNKQTQIKNLTQQIKTAVSQQETLIKQLAIKDLQQRKHQIENYHIRASYSLTRLYDSLAAMDKKP